MLVDINVLLALAWPNHQFHARARAWFAARNGQPWHTCAITQLGFVRLSSNPSFTKEAKAPHDAKRLLARMTAHADHLYLSQLPALSSLDDPWTMVAGPRQVTDAYLVAIARSSETKLCTFDVVLSQHPTLGKDVFVPA